VTAALSVLSPDPVVLEGLPLAIDRAEVLRFQGYKKDVDVPSAQVLAIFEEALALGRTLLAPRVVYRAVAVTGGGADRLDAGVERLHIPQIARLWGAIEAVGAGVCTVGDAVETRVRELFDAREFPLAVMLDSVGSAAAESLAEYANDLLCQAGLEAGTKVTNRISPGYAGWDTAEQAALFRLCPGDPIGVRLNEACFMTPGKSISWLVGIGPAARVDHYFTQCRRCWMRDCAYRRAPATTTVQQPGTVREPGDGV
jgi:cobalamin-dependent methionine synthase-like protein